jgi:hypothetical protein
MRKIEGRNMEGEKGGEIENTEDSGDEYRRVKRRRDRLPRRQ